MANVSLHDVSKVYRGGTRAVTGSTWRSRTASSSCSSGRPGCGKTTALRMVAGLEEITERRRSGSASEVVNDLSPEGARHRDGLPELRALPAHDGVREHRLRACKLRKVRRQEIDAARRRRRGDARARELARPQAAGALRRAAPARRDGPRDRARAARVPDGRAALEPRREAARADARRDRCASSGSSASTTIYVTHDQVEAMTMGDRVAVHAQRRAAAGRHAAAGLRQPGEHVRRRVHRLARR